MDQQLMSMLPILAIFVVMWFLVIRPQQKKAKEHEAMISNLGKGDRVVTNGGLIGTVHNLEDKEISLEIAKDVIIKIARPMIATRLTQTEKPKKVESLKPALSKKKAVGKK